jgi:hypothetical protein
LYPAVICSACSTGSRGMKHSMEDQERQHLQYACPTFTAHLHLCRLPCVCCFAHTLVG